MVYCICHHLPRTARLLAVETLTSTDAQYKREPVA